MSHPDVHVSVSQSPNNAAADTTASVDNSVVNEGADKQLRDLTQQLEQSLLAVITASHTSPSQSQPLSHPRLTPELLIQATQSALANILLSKWSFTQPSESEAPGRSASVDGALRKPIRCYIDGCFDIMHSGHYNAIRQAKALTDILVVGVHSDEEIIKHKGPPVMNNEERLATVKACKWVDEVVFDTPYNPSLELLEELNCDFCVHGDDMSTTADGRDAYEEVKKANRMKIFKRTEGISTTDLVGRLLYMTKRHHIKPTASTSPSHSPSKSTISPKTDSPTTSKLPTSKTIAASVPQLLLESPAAATAIGSPGTPNRALTPANAVADVDAAFASKGISSFLPTTYRITQFSNNRVPGPDDTVVYIDGAFDLFHVGHIETLKRAKSLGTFLYVGLHDDNTVNQHKGKNYPIMNLHERVLNVLSCKFVDEVVIGAPWRIESDLIKTLGINIVASGSNTKFAPGQVDAIKSSTVHHDPYLVPKRLGIFKEIDTSYLLETDDVVERIVENRLKFEQRNVKRSAKERDYLTAKKEFVREI